METPSLATRIRGITLVAAAAVASLVAAPVSAQTCGSSIVSNFNGTAIAGGHYVWFNAVVKVSGVSRSANTTLSFDASRIAFESYTLDVPASRLEFSPTTTVADTTYDAQAGVWVTRLPASYSGNAFLSGLAFQAPAAGLPKGIKPVTWSGRFTSSASGLKVNWQWAAAVYTSFDSNPNVLQVKPVDGNKLDVYRNSDHAGTPEYFKNNVIGGARGGGGSNYTGSYSGTASVTPCADSRQLTLSKKFDYDTDDSPQPVGSDAGFAIEITNTGPTATNGPVVVSDTLDSLLQQASAYVAGTGTCTVSGQSLSCTLSGLDVGETAIVHVSYYLPPVEIDHIRSLRNCAKVTDSDGNSAQGCADLYYGEEPS